MAISPRAPSFPEARVLGRLGRAGPAAVVSVPPEDAELVPAWVGTLPVWDELARPADEVARSRQASDNT